MAWWLIGPYGLVVNLSECSCGKLQALDLSPVMPLFLARLYERTGRAIALPPALAVVLVLALAKC